MNKYVLQLLKKFAGIDIDELQAEFNRVQGENVKISTQLRHASDKISSMEKQISRLEAEATAYQTSVRENEEKHQRAARGRDPGRGTSARGAGYDRGVAAGGDADDRYGQG